MGSLTGCDTAPPTRAPVETRPIQPAAEAPRTLMPKALTPGPAAVPGPLPIPGVSTGPVQRNKARWVPALWAELPGWSQDPSTAAWQALLASCTRQPPESAPAWAATCADARDLQTRLGPTPDEARVRAWIEARLQPWRIEDLDGKADGLLTGYFEPLVDARRHPGAAFQTPLHAPPLDLPPGQPWWTRAEQASTPQAQAALRGRELVYVADPLDALMLHIQGSGRVRLLDEPGADGAPRIVRLAFAAHNGQPYRSIGRWLIEQGELAPDQATWPAIRAWARLHPERLTELLNANPRTVFFREETMSPRGLDASADIGPLGAQGVPLTPGRSIAVDRESIPLGTPVWIVSTEPQAWAAPANAPLPRPLQRLVIAQDTGSAIQGAVRADYFWGWGEGMELMAGRTRQPLRMWALWPRS